MATEADRFRLTNYGFTPDEIDAITTAKTPSGDSQSLDLNDPGWIVACEEHNKVRSLYYDANPGAEEEDYIKFINDWFYREVGSFDPWIWIDQNYFRQHRVISKDKWNAAYSRISALKEKLGGD